MQRPLMKRIEVAGGIAHLAKPFKAKPPDIFLNTINKDLFLFLGIGIVKAEVALAIVLFSQTKIEADRCRMTDMEIPIRLRRKAGDDFITGNMTGGEIAINDLFQKIFRLLENFTSVCFAHG